MNITQIDRGTLVDLICQAAAETHAGTGAAPDNAVSEATRLFGSGGVFDSLGLVSVVLDIEQQVNERFGLSISIADDRSVSQQRSPFRSVGSLADYISVLIQEQMKG